MRNSTNPKDKTRPLIFACSGCSNAGATSDRVARHLDREGTAEMSCLAGVAAGKKPFFKKLAGRHAWVLDGCPIKCSHGVFQNADLPQDTSVTYIRLYEAGLKKNAPPPSDEQFQELVEFARCVGNHMNEPVA